MAEAEWRAATTDMTSRLSSPEDAERKAGGSRNFYAAPKYKLPDRAGPRLLPLARKDVL